MTAFSKQAWRTAALALILIPCAAKAQSGDSKPQDNGQNDQTQLRQQQQKHMALLAQRLHLSDDQKRQWLQIQQQTAQKVRAVRKDDSLTEEQMQAQLKEIHKQQKQQVFDLLTPDQQQELKSFWEEQRQRQQSDKSSSGAPDSVSPSQDKETDKPDELFAGMVSDDPPPQQNKKAGPK